MLFSLNSLIVSLTIILCFLQALDEPSYICKGPVQTVSLQSLVILRIYRLEKIKSLFSACSFGNLPRVEELNIGSCNQLEQIIANEKHPNIMTSGIESCSKSTSNCCALHSGKQYYIHTYFCMYASLFSFWCVTLEKEISWLHSF